MDKDNHCGICGGFGASGNSVICDHCRARQHSKQGTPSTNPNSNPVKNYPFIREISGKEYRQEVERAAAARAAANRAADERAAAARAAAKRKAAERAVAEKAFLSQRNGGEKEKQTIKEAVLSPPTLSKEPLLTPSQSRKRLSVTDPSSSPIKTSPFIKISGEEYREAVAERADFSQKNVDKKDKRTINEVTRSPSSLSKKPLLPPSHSGERLSGVLSGTKCSNHCKSKALDIQETHYTYNLADLEKFPSNRPMPDPLWIGNFEILDCRGKFGTPNAVQLFGRNFYGDFQAHLPQNAYDFDSRLLQFSRNMPMILQFELLPRGNIWVGTFKSGFALSDNISIYFFPRNFWRSRHLFNSLLLVMEKDDLALRSTMNGVDLLLFRSKQLPNAAELHQVPFLWGAFRITEKKGASAVSSAGRNSQVRTLQVGNAVRQQSSTEEIARRNNLQAPPGFLRKDANSNEGESSDLVEVPVLFLI